MIKTAPQIIYQGMFEKKLDITEEGRCRICGGPLLGSFINTKNFYSGSWTDEAFIQDCNSLYVCEPCNTLKKFYSQNLHKGFIATEQSFKWFDTVQDIASTLKNLPDKPFILLFKTWGGMYRRHVMYFSPVNYNREQVSAMFIFHPWQQPGKARDDSMTACNMLFAPEKVLELINQLEKEEMVYQVNPAHHGIEKHLAAYIVGSLKRQELSIKKKTKKK